MSDPKYPHIHVQLSDEDGNAGAIMGRCTREMRREGLPADEINAFRMECISGDYDNLLRTVMKWFETS